MNEHLFKLKKDGKTVGYCKWTEDWGWKYYNDLEPENEFTHFMVAQTGFTAHPFVCKDKNGKDVFAEDSFIYDCCGNFHEKGTGFFVWDEDILGFRLQDTIKKKRVFYFGVDFSCSDIELIEAVAQTKDITAHPFVCKDKKDKDVWKGDQTNKGIAIASFESWVWTYTKDFSTYHWHISIVEDIELIEDKND